MAILYRWLLVSDSVIERKYMFRLTVFMQKEETSVEENKVDSSVLKMTINGYFVV